MPHPQFNHAFLHAHVSTDPGPEDVAIIYDKNLPVYFTPSEDPDTARQLEQFLAHSDFVILRNQYEKLLQQFKQWCSDTNCLTSFIIENEDEPKLSFDVFYHRLFVQLDFFSLRATILFLEGKKSLEQLWLLLNNEYIPFDAKKSVMLDLQIGMIVCADGTLTNIINAKDDLLAFTAINHRLKSIKSKVIQQIALTQIRDIYEDTDVGNEMHRANAYFNYVADQYGLPLIKDTFVDALALNIEELLRFSTQVDQGLTPTVVIEHLIEQIETNLQQILEQIKHSFFDDKESIPSEEASAKKLIQIVELNISKINAFFAPLIAFDSSLMIELTEDDEIRMASYYPTTIKALIAEKFSQLYLSADTHRYVFQFNDGSDNICIYNNGIYWVVHSGAVLACTLELFCQVIVPSHDAPERTPYCQMLDHLLQTYSEAELPLIRHILQTVPGPLLLQLIELKLFSAVAALIESGGIEAQHLGNVSLGEGNEGKNELWLLAYYKQFDLILKLQAKRLITTALLAAMPLEGENANKNVLWLTASAQHFGLIEQWHSTQLITTALLEAMPLEGISAHINSLWIIASHQQFDIIRQWQSAQLITTALLEAMPTEGVDAHISAFFIVAYNQQFDIIRQWQSAHLITKKLLEAMPMEGFAAHINSLWIIANHQQFDLIKQWQRDQLITTELLAAMPLEGKNANKNVLWLVANYQKFDIIRQWQSAQLITTALLEAMPTEGADTNINALWLVANDQQFDLIEQWESAQLITTALLAAMRTQDNHSNKGLLRLLASDHQFVLFKAFQTAKLITKELLSTPITDGIYAGTNLVWVLAFNQQFALLQQLQEDNLITTALLAVIPQVPNAAGITLLWFLIHCNQVDLFKKLLVDGLITKELLAESPKSGIHTDKNVLWVIAKQKLFPLLEQLRAKNLITADLLEAAPQRGPDAGINVLWLIAEQKNLFMIDQFRRDRLLTKRQLEASPLEGPDAGINVLWLIAEQTNFFMIEMLLRDGLLTEKQLLATPIVGIHKGLNVAWFLATHRQFGLLRRLQQNGLGTREILDTPMTRTALEAHGQTKLLQFDQHPITEASSAPTAAASRETLRLFGIFSRGLIPQASGPQNMFRHRESP